jgi:hypothetical protein
MAKRTVCRKGLRRLTPKLRKPVCCPMLYSADIGHRRLQLPGVIDHPSVWRVTSNWTPGGSGSGTVMSASASK